jgi:hypothetical protein
VNREVLRLLLRQSFPDSTAAERRVVTRAAGDLADAERLGEVDVGVTPQRVVDGLSDAPADHGLVERWNWWMGALDVAHGGYERFVIRRWAAG